MSEFFYGVIEGFYGRQWSWPARREMIDYLADQGFGCYIYAPKGDACLRTQWNQLWPDVEFSQLQRLSQHCQQRGLQFGIGLTPFNLFRHYEAEQRQALKDKLEQINQLKVDTLCILFDDMQGDCPDLATRQLSIIDDVLTFSQASKHIVCPSYYSFDPVLEDVFGTMPKDYWTTLGQNLPSDVDIFWTGNKVISSAYSEQDISRVTELFQRKPILWDNYPVNDGKVTSQYLHLQPYTGRPRELNQWTRGHIVNPMNQPALSKLPLSSLSELYQSKAIYNADVALESALDSIPDKGLSALLKRDISLFSKQGLQAIDEPQRKALLEEYSQFNGVMVEEILGWLQGEYRFDPECLTE